MSDLDALSKLLSAARTPDALDPAVRAAYVAAARVQYDRVFRALDVARIDLVSLEAEVLGRSALLEKKP